MGHSLTPSELNEKIKTGEVCLIDVRSPGEHRGESIGASESICVNVISAEQVKAVAGDKPVVLYCQSGKRTEAAVKKLEEAGMADLKTLEGGLNAWKTMGYETIKGQGSIAIERQVRIAAGTLVVLGVTLGFLVSPSLFLLSGIVGAGLIFAGVTDTCGMAILLSKMPWNK